MFFMHSSVRECLSCFQVLAIVNSAAKGTLHVSFRIMVFSGYMPRNGTAGSHASSLLAFVRNLHNTLHQACEPIYIPTHSTRGFPFLHTLASIYC